MRERTVDTLLLWLNRLFAIDPVALGFFAMGIGLAVWARRRVDAALMSGAGETSKNWTTGGEASEEILRAAGLDEVAVEPVRGPFVDYYDPNARTIRLSEAVYEGSSLAMLAVASFEAGHALQHARRDLPLPLWIRDGLAQFARLAPRWIVVTVVVGFVLEVPGLLRGAMVAFPFAVALPLLAMPIERDAARRARRSLAMAALVASGQDETLERIFDALAWRLIDPALPRLRRPRWLQPSREPEAGSSPVERS